MTTVTARPSVATPPSDTTDEKTKPSRDRSEATAGPRRGDGDAGDGAAEIADATARLAVRKVAHAVGSAATDAQDAANAIGHAAANAANEARPAGSNSDKPIDDSRPSTGSAPAAGNPDDLPPLPDHDTQDDTPAWVVASQQQHQVAVAVAAIMAALGFDQPVGPSPAKRPPGWGSNLND